MFFIDTTINFILNLSCHGTYIILASARSYGGAASAVMTTNTFPHFFSLTLIVTFFSHHGQSGSPYKMLRRFITLFPLRVRRSSSCKLSLFTTIMRNIFCTPFVWSYLSCTYGPDLSVIRKNEWHSVLQKRLNCEAMLPLPEMQIKVAS